MFVATRDTGVRRRNRIYTNTKAARSSRISLLSAFTATTTGSGGSNSTITQDSYNKSQKPKRKHRRRTQPETKNRSVDVFDFLVKDKAKSKESLTVSPVEKDDRVVEVDSKRSLENEGEDEPEITVHLDEGEPDPEGYYRSMSDSGISMESSSSGSNLPHHYLPVLHEEPLDQPGYQPRPGNELAIVDPRWAWPSSSPQPYLEGFIPPPCPAPPPAIMYEVPSYPPYPYPPYTPYGTPPPLHEEEIRGSRITIREPAGQRSTLKCFRSFNRLSTRLILQTQDEIAELEEELKELDKETIIAEEGSDHDSSSSRAERQDRGNREEEIYRELHIKIDNYYHALEMLQKIDNISRPATKSDLQKHHEWLGTRIMETSRVRHLVSNDLRRLSLPQHPIRDESRVPPTFQPQYLAYSALINGVLPLIMFKVITSVLNRLIFLFLVVVAGSVGQDRLRPKVGKDELTCTLLCICISAFAAIFL